MNRSPNFVLSVMVLFVLSQSVFSANLQQGNAPQTPLRVTVTAKGFEPSSLTVPLNAPAKITFVRVSDEVCATDVVIPEYNLKRELPLNTPVLVELTPKKSGEIVFACGMNMFKGKLIVAEK